MLGHQRMGVVLVLVVRPLNMSAGPVSSRHERHEQHALEGRYVH